VIKMEVARKRSELSRLGIPAYGSSEQIFASSSADFSMRSIPAAEKSLEYVLAERCPKKTRTPMAREPDSFSVSTWPSRTTVENSSPSRTTHSAAVAPPFIARWTTSWATEARPASSLGALGSRVVVIFKISEVRSQIAEVKVKAPDARFFTSAI